MQTNKKTSDQAFDMAKTKIKKNKLLDLSHFFLYTWTVAGDGG